MMERIVAIHQPNFVPWLGYFDKIIRADLFVLLDNVQFPKTGGTWINRVKLLVNGSEAWTTVPIIRNFQGVRSISEIKINNETDWRGKFLKTIQTNYGKAPYFREILPLLNDLMDNPTDSLSEFNIAAIRTIVSILKIDSEKLVLGSEVLAEGSATELLISITKKLEGTCYMCGGGAGGYQEDEKFASAGIDLVYQGFTHPAYPQLRSQQFVPGLSIIDTLMNCGIEGTRTILSPGTAG